MEAVTTHMHICTLSALSLIKTEHFNTMFASKGGVISFLGTGPELKRGKMTRVTYFRGGTLIEFTLLIPSVKPGGQHSVRGGDYGEKIR